MQYIVKYACGHEGTVTLFGPSKTRESRLRWLSTQSCPKCEKEAREEQHRKENEESAHLAEEWELPRLNGTPKQIAWANTIRVQFIDKLASVPDEGEMVIKFLNRCFRDTRVAYDSNFSSHDRGIQCTYAEWQENHPVEAIQFYKQFAATKTDASWWIENRDNLPAAVQIASGFQWYDDCSVPKEIQQEELMAPENPSKPGIVHISGEPNNIRVRYDYTDKQFAQIMIQCRMRQSSYSWNRRITEITGTYTDRATELAMRLLKAGFRVSIASEDVRKMVIQGEYIPECRRWVIWESPDQFQLNWSRKEPDNEEIYLESRRIRGSRYRDGKVYAPLSSYEEIISFAKKFQFCISSDAQTAIKQHQDALEQAIVVSAKDPDEILQKLKDSGSAIDLSDLRDDE